MKDVPVPGDAAADVVARPGSALWWRHTALRLRAGLAFGLVALVVASGLALTAHGLVRTNLVEDRQASAERQAYTNARLLRSRLDPRPDDMTQLLAGLQVGPRDDALLYIDGRWFSSSVELSASELPGSLAEAVASGDAARQRFEVNGRPVVGIGVPINALGARYFEVTSLEDVEQSLDTLARSFLIAAIVAAVAGAALGVWFSSLILSPLRRFAGVAHEIVGGATNSRLDAGGDPDLEPLADSFNEMLDDLDERMERERRFASDVSHEIRGPLAALSSAVSIVDRRRASLPAEVVPAVDALETQVRAFNQLVIDLLEISRFDARTAEFDGREHDIVSLCAMVAATRGHDSVQVHGTPGEVIVNADSRRIEQVVTNLLDNARLYAGGATDLTVTATEAGARIAVEDRGPGVPEEERTTIFARFQRGHAADLDGVASGTGLGLALSTQHVELHGGALWVEDREGGGARFVAEWPL